MPTKELGLDRQSLRWAVATVASTGPTGVAPHKIQTAKNNFIPEFNPEESIVTAFALS